MDYKKSIPFQLSGIALALLSVNAQAQSSCSPGTYDEPPIDGICLEAPAGFYVPNAGATSAIAAPAGSFVATSGATAPTLAAPGYFVSSTGQTAAEAAPPGTYVATAGAVAATLAPVGTFVSDFGQTAPTDAPAGSFVDTSGATAPTLAAPGYFVSSTGQTAAEAAPPGTYVATAGAVEATLAPVGTFVSGFGQTAPEEAPVGRYVPIEGATEALDAPAGSFVNTTGASAATLAPPGTYVPFTGASSPIKAPPGQYVPMSGSITSLNCPAGGDTPFEGSTACRDVSQVIDDPELVGPEYELLKYSTNTINLWTDSLGPSDTQINIRNATDDVASPIGLMDLTILDISISNDVDNVFSLASNLFDGGGNFIPVTIGADYDIWSVGWAFNIGLNSVDYGQFTAQLDILTDQNAAIGSAGDVFSYNLVGSVPEPGTLFLLSSGLMGMLGWNFRRRKFKLSV